MEKCYCILRGGGGGGAKSVVTFSRKVLFFLHGGNVRKQKCRCFFGFYTAVGGGWVAELETISGQAEVTALQSSEQSVRLSVMLSSWKKCCRSRAKH